MSDTRTEPKPIDAMTDAEYDAYWDAIKRRSGRPLSLEEKAKLHEGGVSTFGIYEPDPDYLVEVTAEGRRYLWRDGARVRALGDA